MQQKLGELAREYTDRITSLEQSISQKDSELTVLKLAASSLLSEVQNILGKPSAKTAKK